MQIKLIDLKKSNNQILKKNLAKINNLIYSGSYTNGKYVRKFENVYAKYNDFKYCICVNSGTSALHLSLLALNLKKNSEIIVSPHTFLATISAIEYANLKPKFFDINDDNLNLDSGSIEKSISKKTKAVIFTDMHGNVSGFNKIQKICIKKKIPLIQDSAQSHGIANNMKLMRNFLKCQSFYPTKNLGGIAEGGCVLTNNKIFYKKIFHMKNWGILNGTMTFQGFNYRMSELNAFFLIKKLKDLKKNNKIRRSVANLYKEKLATLSSNKNIKFQNYESINGHSFHHLIIRVNKSIRNNLMSFLSKNGIETNRHYKIPCHKEPYFTKKFNLKNLKLKNIENLYKEMITVPCNEYLNVKDVILTCDTIKKFFQMKNHANKRL